jgi:hypothetical protein
VRSWECIAHTGLQTFQFSDAFCEEKAFDKVNGIGQCRLGDTGPPTAQYDIETPVGNDTQCGA